MDDTDSTEQRRESVKQLRERLQLSGASVLSNAELISVVFGTGPSTPGVIRRDADAFCINEFAGAFNH